MLDESLLDAPDALGHADTDGLLRGAAQAGARVRTAVRQAEEAGLAELRAEGRPRGVLIAGPAPAAPSVARLFAALGNGGVPVTTVHPTGARSEPGALRWTLPGWAGSFDLLLLVTADGTEPGLATLAEQAYRRGCTTAAVAPAGSPLAQTLTGIHGLTLPPATPPPTEPAASGTPGGRSAAGTVWALLTPLLALADRLDLLSAPPPALLGLADRLDQVAERCGPAQPTYGNPAKTLAVELGGDLPLLWTEGRVATAVGRHAAATLSSLPGHPALTARLPEALRLHDALLGGAFGGAAESEDFFRDRVAEPRVPRARVVLLRDRAPDGDSAATAARDLAFAHGVAVSELAPEDDEAGPWEAAAQLLATMDFTAVYLTLARAGS